MPSDPYTLLKVSRDATDLELKQAYERELKMAHKMDAFKHAQEVDAAYSILRDPHRRAMYDDHGLVAPTVRDSPLERSGTSSSSAFSALATSRPAARPKRAFNFAQPSRKRLYISLGVIGVAGLIGAGAYLQSNLTGSGEPTTIAPHTPSGQVEMVCRVGGGAAPLTTTVDSGQLVRCPNGVAPKFRRVARDRPRH